MKELIRINSIVLLLIVLPLLTMAQKTTTKKKPTANTNDPATHVPINKAEKVQADADNYIKMAQGAKDKLKILFPSKPGDTVYAVIAGIIYTDPNLKMLKQKLEDIKSTKGLTSSYRNNTVIVKILYKGGDASKLYDNLSDEIKALFVIEDIEGNRMILTYKLAKPSESSAETKPIPAATNQ